MGQPSGLVRKSPPNEAEDLSSSGDVNDILNTVFRIQARRAESYASLNEKFQEMLTTRNEASYRQEIAKQTVILQECSSEIRKQISLAGKSPDAGEVADDLKRLQGFEQTKLQHTLILHALRKAGSEQRFSWQKEGTSSSEQAEELQSAHPGHHRCQHTAEPTEEDFTGALREATQALEEAVNGINELLSELRITLYELE